MQAGSTFGGIGSTLAGFGNLLSADGRKSSKSSPKPGSPLLPAEHISSLGNLSSLSGSISNLIGDDKKSPIPSLNPDASPLPLPRALFNAGDADPPAAPVQATEEPPAPTEAPTNVADAVVPTTDETVPPPTDTATTEEKAEEKPPVEPIPAPEEPSVPTGDGEGNDPEEDKEEVDGKKAKINAPPIKAANSKGGKKKKKK
ncbi:hypothetical protein C8R48DRAFT_696187 [Suillus tomentosus]|nr:hypothetical protein C8R48DRAFT_696187 [Suillus tomentosus]